MARIYLMRHGETPFNVRKVVTGRGSDPELTENGVNQAHQAGKALFEEHGHIIELVVSSNMTRTNQTAEIVNNYLEKEIIYDIRIQEIDRGLLEGQEIMHVRSHFDPLPDHESHPEYGGESRDSFRARMVSAMCEYFQFPLKGILLVSHAFSGLIVNQIFHEKEISHLGNSEFLIFDPENIENLAGKCSNETLISYLTDDL